MKRIRSFTTLATAALIFSGSLAGCSAGPDVVEYHANYPIYGSSADLVNAADLIVRGAPIKSRVEKMYPDVSTEGDPVRNPQAGLRDEEVRRARESQAVVVTVTTVRVAEVIKGAVAVGDVVQVSQLGGELDGVRYADSGTTLLPSDAKASYVLFLAAYGAGKPHDLLNPGQAMYLLSDGGALKPVRAENSLGISSLAGLRSTVAG
jgi:hypothetical protein